MRILLVGLNDFSYRENLESINNTLLAMGHETQLIKVNSFSSQCNYFIKKFHKLGNNSFLEKYESILNQRILSSAPQLCPELNIFFNGLHIHPKTLQELQKSGKTVLMLIDNVRGMLRQNGFEETLHFYNKIFSFDPGDIPFLKQHYNLHCEYFSNMYNPLTYYPEENVDKDIDICFVGTPYRQRLKVLQYVADYCDKNKRSFAAYGKYWNRGYFWKRMVLENKFKPLGKFVHNRIITAQEAAQIYRRSRICINMHFNDQEGINVRTFDILGTKSFQLVDYKKQINELFKIGEELVTYDNTDELLYKLDEFLNNSAKRNIIAANGYKKAAGSFTTEKVMKNILAKLL